MSDLKSYELDLNYNKTKEQVEDEKEVERYMKIYNMISDVFIEEKVNLEEALKILDTMLSATQLFIANEYKEFQEVNNI